MSRNFELLQKAAEERDREAGVSTPTGTIASPLHEAPVREPWVPQPPPIIEEQEGATLPKSAEGLPREELTKLVHRLFQPDGTRVVVFSSVERGAGCSWLTAQAARTLAGQGRNSVCVVDGNFRSPDLHSFFGVENRQGLTEAVLDGGRVQDYLRNTGLPNLWLLTSGNPERSAQAVSATRSLVECIRQLRTQFEYVLIDSAPMNLVADAVTLASAGDGIALVLKANSSRREIAQKMLQDAKSANVRILGAVLNQRTFPVPESVYRRL